MSACPHDRLERADGGWQCAACCVPFVPTPSQASYGHLAGRHLEIVTAVDLHWRRHGYAPTIRDIVAATGLESSSTVQHHVNRLVSRGHLLRNPRAQRSLRLPD